MMTSPMMESKVLPQMVILLLAMLGVLLTVLLPVLSRRLLVEGGEILLVMLQFQLLLRPRRMVLPNQVGELMRHGKG